MSDTREGAGELLARSDDDFRTLVLPNGARQGAEEAVVKEFVGRVRSGVGRLEVGRAFLDSDGRSTKPFQGAAGPVMCSSWTRRTCPRGTVARHPSKNDSDA
jgi:hypothetical protein